MSMNIILKGHEINIRPQKDWVIIEPIKNEEEMVKGVIIPENRRQKFTNKGYVLAVGLGRVIKGIMQPIEVKQGDIVLVSNWGRCECIPNDDGRVLFLVGAPLIDAVIEEE